MKNKTTHDLRTYKGWIARATELLQGREDWAALVDKSGFGYVVQYQGGIYAAPVKGRLSDVTYNTDDLLDFDESAWDSETKCWEGATPEDCVSTLEMPILVLLPSEPEPSV